MVFANVAHAERRLALIIGNDNYQHLEKLQKAAADARQYAEVLKAKGFDQVELKTDLSRGDMELAIASFVDQIEAGDTVVFAYSGHGWSDGAQNYVVGIDAPEQGSQEFLARISIPLKNGVDGIIDDMDRKGARLKVAIIDACRSNPFTPPPSKRAIGLNRGLVRIEPPHGTFVVFSAGAGQSALDRLSESDANPNSVFTRVFAPLLRADVTLQEAVKAAQAEVAALARSVNEDQQPAYYDEVLGSACLGGGCADKPELPPKTVSPDEVTWNRMAASTDATDFDSFVRLFPNSPHAAEAAARAASLRSGQTKVARLEPSKTPDNGNSNPVAPANPDTPIMRILSGQDVGGAAFSPDGKLFATGGGADIVSVRIWDASTGKLLRTLAGNTSNIHEVQFSPDGSRLISAGADGAARIWAVAAGRLLMTLKSRADNLTAARFTADGSMIATGGTHFAEVWDAQTGRLIRYFNTKGTFESVVFTPDSSLLALAATADKLNLVNPTGGLTIRSFGGPKDSVHGLAISPDGRRLAAAYDDSKKVVIWELKTGRQIWEQGFNDGVSSVSFSPDGRYLAAGSFDNSVQVWDTQTGLLVRQFEAADEVWSVTFSPDGRRLLVASQAGLTLWDVRDIGTNVAGRLK
jgi:WD40 repeat protein